MYLDTDDHAVTLIGLVDGNGKFLKQTFGMYSKDQYGKNHPTFYDISYREPQEYSRGRVVRANGTLELFPDGEALVRPTIWYEDGSVRPAERFYIQFTSGMDILNLVTGRNDHL